MKGTGLGHPGPRSASRCPCALDSRENGQGYNHVEIYRVTNTRDTAQAEHHQGWPSSPPTSPFSSASSIHYTPFTTFHDGRSSILQYPPNPPNLPLEKVPGVFIFLPHSGKRQEPQLQSLLGLNSVLRDTSNSKFTTKNLGHSA